MDDTIQHTETDHRGAFSIEREGKRVATMTYSRANAALIIIDHTEVDPSLEGQGVGRRLLDALVAWARATDTKILTTCPFAGAQFAKDASLRDVHA